MFRISRFSPLPTWRRRASRRIARPFGGLPAGCTVALACGLIGGGLVGCERETPVSPGVSQPVAIDSDSVAPTEVLDQGGFELPTGPIPDAPLNGEPKSLDGGLEMPKDAVLPQDVDASNSPVIRYGSWEEIESFARASGRVTVVDLWSLACEPCLKEFPGLVRLQESLGSKVQCVAVDLDFDGRKSRPPEHYEAQVIAFLKSVQAAGFPTFISVTPSDEVYAAAKLASIPAVLVFDAEGQLVQVFVDAGESAGFTYDKDVIPLVRKLVG